jgi:beta-galactosidase/beta-glucuronidase
VFDCPENWAGQNVMVEFEGVYMNAEILLNGNLIRRIHTAIPAF